MDLVRNPKSMNSDRKETFNDGAPDDQRTLSRKILESDFLSRTAGRFADSTLFGTLDPVRSADFFHSFPKNLNPMRPWKFSGWSKVGVSLHPEPFSTERQNAAGIHMSRGKP